MKTGCYYTYEIADMIFFCRKIDSKRVKDIAYLYPPDPWTFYDDAESECTIWTLGEFTTSMLTKINTKVGLLL